MPSIPAARRLSPKVRRLLREHDLSAGSVTGTGTGGRITPHDVLGATGGRRATPANETALDVDVTVLLASLAAAQREFFAHHGFDLDLEVAVASAAATALAARSGLVAAGPAAAGDAGRGVVIGLQGHAQGEQPLALVPDAQYLTVAGLARRGRTAATQPVGAATPTVVVTTEREEPADALAARVDIGWITVGQPSPQQVTSIDHLGQQAITTRSHATLRLRSTSMARDTAADLLGAVGDTIASWTLPVGP